MVHSFSKYTFETFYFREGERERDDVWAWKTFYKCLCVFVSVCASFGVAELSFSGFAS